MRGLPTATMRVSVSVWTVYLLDLSRLLRRNVTEFTCICGCEAIITDASPSDLFASENCHHRYYGTEDEFYTERYVEGQWYSLEVAREVIVRLRRSQTYLPDWLVPELPPFSIGYEISTPSGLYVNLDSPWR